MYDMTESAIIQGILIVITLIVVVVAIRHMYGVYVAMKEAYTEATGVNDELTPGSETTASESDKAEDAT